MTDANTKTSSNHTQSHRFKWANFGVSILMAIGGIAVIGKPAQAISALDVVNGISASGGVGISKDIAYGDQPLQNLDIYYPKPLVQAIQSHSTQNLDARYPMVVFVHGGSWESGTKEDYAFVGQSFAQAGYVTAVINYRKAPAHVFPNYVDDTARAIAWSYQNAGSFYADSQRLGVVGHSAGAFNMMAAVSNADFLAPYGVRPSDIGAAVGIAGPYSYDFHQYGGAVAFPKDATPDEVMPDRHLKGVQPPYLLLTAEKDNVVYDTNTIKMTQALRNHGATVENAEIKGASHASSIGAMASPLRWVNEVRVQVLTYLDQKLHPVNLAVQIPE